MTLIAKAEGESNYIPVPEGIHLAICYAVIDIGMQYSEKFDKSMRKVVVLWEIPSETYEKDGQALPMAAQKEYSLSLGEKATLRKDLQAWRGKAFTEEELQGFDLKNILGKPCQLQIIHTEKNGKTYANIAGIMNVIKGMEIPKPTNKLIAFDLDTDIDKIDTLPSWIQEKIKASETYKQRKSIQEKSEEADEEPPEETLPPWEEQQE